MLLLLACCIAPPGGGNGSPLPCDSASSMMSRCSESLLSVDSSSCRNRGSSSFRIDSVKSLLLRAVGSI
uniref:Putative secreted protein n=1 Tax=Anopheles darlingi TaxID=43151 RepID=A0A2M4DMM2_ANODA